MQQVSYASIAKRLASNVVDFLVLIIPMIFIGELSSLNPVLDVVGPTGATALSSIVQQVMWGIYFVLRWSSTGQTPGMKAVGTFVIHARTGVIISRQRALVRVVVLELMGFLCTVPLWGTALGFSGGWVLCVLAIVVAVLVWCVIDPRKQSIWDKAASTVVIDAGTADVSTFPETEASH